MIKGNLKRLVKLFAAICIVSFSLMFLVQCKPTQALPNKGIWYCEDLQIQICFDKNPDMYETHIISEKKVNCTLSTDYGNRFFSIMYQDTINSEYNYDTCFYSGECIYFDEEKMVTKEVDTGREFVFERLWEQGDGSHGSSGEPDAPET